MGSNSLIEWFLFRLVLIFIYKPLIALRETLARAIGLDPTGALPYRSG